MIWRSDVCRFYFAVQNEQIYHISISDPSDLMILKSVRCCTPHWDGFHHLWTRLTYMVDFLSQRWKKHLKNFAWSPNYCSPWWGRVAESTGAPLLENNEASAKLTTANGGTFTWAQLDSVANHVTDRSISDWRALTWLATESSWARRKLSAICSGKLISVHMIPYDINRRYGIDYICVSLWLNLMVHFW